LCCPVFRQRPCDELTTRSRSPTVCNMIKKLSNQAHAPKLREKKCHAKDKRVATSMQLVVFAVLLISSRRMKGHNIRPDRDCFLLNLFSFHITDHLHTSLQLTQQLNNSTSSVGIATRLRPGGPKSRGWIPGWRFLLSATFGTALGSTQPPQW
jgi:hypothetical protein